jgi:hypothetical protein
MRERPLSAVPKSVAYGVVAGLMLQALIHAATPSPQARAVDLPSAPSVLTLRAASLDEPIGLAKFLTLYLQAFDSQPGVSIPFRDLDYPRVIEWLKRILALDPAGQYPLLAASRLYAEVPVESKQRAMLDFVHDAFLEDPNRRWPWLAHGVIIAKHRLRDLPLAASYAAALRDYATGHGVPHWAQQMEIFVREDMGEVESAKILLGGLLESGKISDPHELTFLTNRLKALESAAVAVPKN